MKLLTPFQFVALGIIFILLALGIIVFTLLFEDSEKPSKTYTSYRPNPLCNPSDYMRYPKNVDEVVAIVKEAISRGVKVKAFGARHSQTDIICTDGIPVDMNKLNYFQMNADNSATFGAGVTLYEAGKFLLKHGRALRTTPLYGGITLGGARGTGAHGSSIKYNSTLSEQVIKITVVNGLGQILIVSDQEELKSFKTHLGLLGIVVDVTFDTVPLYNVLVHNYVTSDKVLTNGVALNWAKTADQLILIWFPNRKEVVIANFTFVPCTTPGEARNSAIETTSYFNFIASRAKEITCDLSSSKCAAASTLGNTFAHLIEIISQYSLTRQTPGFAPIYTEDGVLFKNPAVGYPHAMLAALCSEKNGKACGWDHGEAGSNMTMLDSEISIALNDLPAFIKTAKDIIKKTPTTFPLLGMFVRFSGKNDISMSMSYERDSANVEFGMWKRTDPYKKASGSLAGYQTILQTLAKKFNGRAHWGKVGLVYHSSEMLDLKLDPKLRQKFVVTRCALLDNCFCSNNSDCADTQRCTSLPGYPEYPVCKTINEVSKGKFPPRGGLLIWFMRVFPTLVSAVVAECPTVGLNDTVPDAVVSLIGVLG